MISNKELGRLIQQLRSYHHAINATSGGLHQLQTQEAQSQLELRLQAANTIKAEVEEEFQKYLQQAHLWLESQQQRLEIARQSAEEKKE